ncbi:hypothetical protein [Actinotalea sp. K2]|uniref:hypothetical protein n=1 Tax=Actinotalea sp. K2 TaxID=2939438 RepID=UPI0020177F66|nr:hypothetical protein [Actinotalea sp. K2]MCL3861678.1 hypothetical protein [Actinotalea sp. K2]
MTSSSDPQSSSPRLPKVRASELVGRGWLNTGGRDVTLADLRGKIVLLDFWTFCFPKSNSLSAPLGAGSDEQ